VDIALLCFDGRPDHHDGWVLVESLVLEAEWDGDVRSVNVDSQEHA
jgi:hypothetical protein